VADDVGIREQALHVLFGEVGDPVEVEVAEGGAKTLPLIEDGAPAQPGLKPLQAQFLEQAAVVTDRKAPFVVVIVGQLRHVAAPEAARLAVGAGDRGGHGGSGHGFSMISSAMSAFMTAPRW
jgi:hypothetical protein